MQKAARIFIFHDFRPNWVKNGKFSEETYYSCTAEDRTLGQRAPSVTYHGRAPSHTWYLVIRTKLFKSFIINQPRFHECLRRPWQRRLTPACSRGSWNTCLYNHSPSQRTSPAPEALCSKAMQAHPWSNRVNSVPFTLRRKESPKQACGEKYAFIVLMYSFIDLYSLPQNQTSLNK